MHLSTTYTKSKRGLNISAAGPRLGSTKPAFAMRGALILAVLSALLMAAARPAQAQTEKVLYSFNPGNGTDGFGPFSGVVYKKGSLYGTTSQGGAYGWGTVFEITPEGTEKVLYGFEGSPDGGFPYAGVVFGKNGNLYGTTYECGEYGCGNYPAGTVFELATTGKKAGTEKVLHSFPSQSDDGYGPYSALVLDKEGNLYGTTVDGGTMSNGTVFEITSTGTEKVLYSFSAAGSGDGYGPWAGLVHGKEGNLYGTTFNGGAYGLGTVFEITSEGTEKVLYSFEGSPDGYSPTNAALVFDKKGNLYGTTSRGGKYNYGTVFELTASGAEKVLYSFGGQSGGSTYPGGLVFDKKGNLYGTAGGGTYNAGTVFELTAAGTEKVLYSFNPDNGTDGYDPGATLVFDKEGNLYGTTASGGWYGAGTVFEVTP